MSDEKRSEQVMQVLCRGIEKRNIQFRRTMNNIMLQLELPGEIGCVEAICELDETMETILMATVLPCRIPPARRMDMVVAVAVATGKLTAGSFWYTYESNRIVFVLRTVYRDSVPQEELVDYMIDTTLQTVALYDEKFYKLAQETVTLAEFLKLVQ